MAYFMDYRHEWKHEINRADLLILRQRLRAVASPDPHARDGTYTVRSLYFDNACDKALQEKLDGVSRREKFRIRYYNGDTSVIRLEKKSRLGGLGNKQSAALTAGQVRAIAEGSLDWMPESPDELVRELYAKMRIQGLRPKTIVDYTREPFVFAMCNVPGNAPGNVTNIAPGNVANIAPGNVRITLDYNIRTALRCRDFLEPDCPTVPAGNAPVILEVKWDAFLPDIIRDAVQLPGRHVTAFSKYAQCRIYG